MSEVDWDAIRGRLDALAADPGAQALFGASGHRFRLLSALSEANLSEAEAQWGVRLPEDYRAYLLRVSAGGSGPGYGLSPLVRESGRWRWRSDEGETDLDRLAEPFPAHLRDPEGLRNLMAEEPVRTSAIDEEAYETTHWAWEERMEAFLGGPERTVGAICLSHEGCGYTHWLVVSGAARGAVWIDNRPADQELAPLHESFTAWYLHWLTRAEKTLSR